MIMQTITPEFARMIIASVEDGLIAPDEPIAREARRVLGDHIEAPGFEDIITKEKRNDNHNHA